MPGPLRVIGVMIYALLVLVVLYAALALGSTLYYNVEAGLGVRIGALDKALFIVSYLAFIHAVVVVLAVLVYRGRR